MKKVVLGREFFCRDAFLVAEELLGKVLVRKIGEKELRGVINEVEVYEGFEDKASHAYRGRTKRNASMFESGGLCYVYLVYGMYWMLNFVTGDFGYPAAVLIRGVSEFDGPGKLTRAFEIDGSFDGALIEEGSGIWVEDVGNFVEEIFRSARIGVGYAGEWTEREFRMRIDLKDGKFRNF